MELNDIILRRLEIFIETIENGPDLEIDEDSELGEPPIGWDNTQLKGEIWTAPLRLESFHRELRGARSAVLVC